MENPCERLIVALDVENAERARSIVDELDGQVGAFKIGLQLFTSAGPSFVAELVKKGAKIFLDLKFHDIPNTVANASLEAARLGVWMFNVHASGGGEMMRAASDKVRDFCLREGSQAPLMIAVTVLTSSSSEVLREIGYAGGVDESVSRLAALAADSGLDGVVASANEVGLIRAAVPLNGFTVVTPGIRPAFAANDDQRRVMGPGAALKAGSDYLVIGRPITNSANMSAAVAAVVAEIEGGEQV